MPRPPSARRRRLIALPAALAAATLARPATSAPGAASPTNAAHAPMTDTTLPAAADAAETDDPFLWLEDVQGERALAWVRERNEETLAALSSRPDFEPMRRTLLDLLNAQDRIPAISRRGRHVYNLWQDANHPRGLWRRTTLADYAKPEPAWETVLDLDALGRAEGENWVWAGAQALAPEYRLALVQLSRGGADATVVREFDLEKKAFVEDGFFLPEAKTDVAWWDADTLVVGTDTGAGSLTDSGYPRTARRWKRGTPLADAPLLFEGERSDVWAGAEVDRRPGHERVVLVRALDFYRRERWLLRDDGTRVAIPLPEDASLSFMNSAGDAADTALVELRSDFVDAGRTWPRGALLALPAARLFDAERPWQMLFEPSARRSLAGYATTRTHLIVNVLEDVASRLEEWQRMPQPDGTQRWTRRAIDAPFPGTLSVQPLHDPMLRDDPHDEDYLLGYTDFLTPDSLLLGRAGRDARQPLKALPPSFDAEGMRAEQFFAASADGARVPYFVVWPKGATADGTNPTLLYGYGGFEVSLQPWYSRAFGAAWYRRGGVLVVANIRGGGEYGPGWHRAAVREHKQRSYDDFAAVAQDLIERRITSARHLGIQGGSNGGLLVGAAFTQRPELFNAVVCQVPLLDMRRYHRLLAGASWMAEYGNPDDPADWAFIRRYSPYQNLRADRRYPRVLFTTSTRDDRVHPGHARKMAARMLAQGHALLYYENIEGGHGGAADNAQRASLQAIEFSYLWMQLGR